MPGILSKQAHMSAEEEAGFEGGGGIAKKTQEDSARTMKMFKVTHIFFYKNQYFFLSLKCS